MIENRRHKGKENRRFQDRRQTDVPTDADRRQPPNRRIWTGRRTGFDKGTFDLEDPSRPIL